MNRILYAVRELGVGRAEALLALRLGIEESSRTGYRYGYA